MSERNALLRRIALGEDSVLEFKQVLLAGAKVTAPGRDQLADELAGMANSAGGTVLLGVEDKRREVLGIPVDRLEAVEIWLLGICRDSVKPPLDAVIRRIELPDVGGQVLPVLRIDIGRSLYVHRSPGGYFRRIGSSNREVWPDQLARLFQERSQTRVIRFDEAPVPHTSPADLDQTLASRFLPRNADVTETLLRKLRVVADDGNGVPRLTVAGVLLCTREPESWMSHAQVQAVAYAGARRDINYQIDARDIAGPLDEQVLEALRFVRRNMRVDGAKPLMRVERPQFSERAIFEALVNAVAHRDYSMSGARVRLHMFEDRIELYVPGALANTLTPDSMHLRQYSRNELVVSLLARCRIDAENGISRSRMMERRGDGVPIILEESTDLSGRAPEYLLIDDTELRLLIWGATG